MRIELDGVTSACERLSGTSATLVFSADEVQAVQDHLSRRGVPQEILVTWEFDGAHDAIVIEQIDGKEFAPLYQITCANGVYQILDLRKGCEIGHGASFDNLLSGWYGL